MDENLKPIEQAIEPEVATEVAAAVEAEATAVPVEATPDAQARGRRGAAPRGARRNTRQGRRPERVRSEYDQKILSMRRVTRVVAGGRRFSFSVTLVAGNRKGQVGVGMGKANDTALAIEKAFRDAKKHMVTVPLTDNKSIPYDVRAKYASGIVEIRPSKGRGLVAGGAVRSILEFGGITDVTAKILSRSKNAINNARATVKALQTLRSKRKIA